MTQPPDVPHADFAQTGFALHVALDRLVPAMRPGPAARQASGRRLSTFSRERSGDGAPACRRRPGRPA